MLWIRLAALPIGIVLVEFFAIVFWRLWKRKAPFDGYPL
jgi:hypothetical protein